MLLSQSDALPQLSKALKDNTLIIFVGSGISSFPPTNLPVWDQFVLSFVTWCRDDLPKEFKDLEPATKSWLERAVDLATKAPDHLARHKLEVLGTLREHLRKAPKSVDPDKFFMNWLGVLLNYERDPATGKRRKRSHNPAHTAIVSTSYPVIVTSNYDKFLREAATLEGFDDLSGPALGPNDASEIAARIHTRRACLVSAHGDFEYRDDKTLDDLVLTPRDYLMYERRFQGMNLVLEAIFLRFSVLFIGYGGSDPHFEALIDKLAEAYKFSGAADLPQYYIYMDEKKINPFVTHHREERRTHFVSTKDYGTETIPFLENLRAISPRKVV